MLCFSPFTHWIAVCSMAWRENNFSEFRKRKCALQNWKCPVLVEILISKTVFLKWLYNDAVYTSAPIRINAPLLAKKYKTSDNCKLGECVWWGGWVGVVAVVVRDAKLDELVRLRNQNQALLSIWISAALFISIIAYHPTLQFVTI